MPATYDDAALIVQLVRWGTEMGLDEASTALFSDGFDAASASVNDPPVRKMLTFGETVATLVKNGVLDKRLVLDLWWVQGAWARVAPAARRERERLEQPRLYENVEELASSPEPGTTAGISADYLSGRVSRSTPSTSRSMSDWLV